MNMSVSNSSINIGEIKSSAQTAGKPNKEVGKKSFAEIQAGQLALEATTSSANRVNANSASASSATSTINLNGSQTADQLLKQGGISTRQSDAPKAASDSSRVSQQSVEATATSAQSETLSASQREDQLLVQGRLSIQQGTDPKAAADGSKPAGELVGAAATNTAQATTAFAAGTFKAMFGELPSTVNRSGLSGIVDGRGHNLTNQEITSYFEQNPSTTQMEQDKITMGLSDAQMANAIAIALGHPLSVSSLDSDANRVTSSSGGAQNTVNNLYNSAWGVSGGTNAALTTSGAIDYLA